MNQRTNFIKRNIMKTILITGGTGFIGSHTTVELQKAGYNVVIADNLSNSNENVIDNIEKITNIRPSFIKVDLSKEDECKKVFDKYPDIEGSNQFCSK
jgi:UDP-glucose 4-epimerase